MFNKLFKRPDTVETYNSAPLTDERLSFLHHLRDCGYEKVHCGTMPVASFVWLGFWR